MIDKRLKLIVTIKMYSIAVQTNHWRTKDRILPGRKSEITGVGAIYRRTFLRGRLNESKRFIVIENKTVFVCRTGLEESWWCWFYGENDLFPSGVFRPPLTPDRKRRRHGFKSSLQ